MGWGGGGGVEGQNLGDMSPIKSIFLRPPDVVEPPKKLFVRVIHKAAI